MELCQNIEGFGVWDTDRQFATVAMETTQLFNLVIENWIRSVFAKNS